MLISSNFNRFYHSLIKELYNQLQNPLMIEGIGVLYIQNIDMLKQALKLVNLDYPRIDYKPISTRDITNKQLVEHIEFIFKVAYQNGYEFEIIESEWKQILQENKNTKEKI